jgi:hypothetical protein
MLNKEMKQKTCTEKKSLIEKTNTIIKIKGSGLGSRVVITDVFG